MCDNNILKYNDLILVTGSSGFIGTRVVKTLLDYGFNNIRCFVRPSSDINNLKRLIAIHSTARIEIIEGNLLSIDDCRKATKDISIIIHLAAGRGEKSYPDAYMNSVVTTRNLLESLLGNLYFRRFINISSLSVYSASNKFCRRIVDESYPVESAPKDRSEAYVYAKVKQEEILWDYHRKHNIPFVILRPGVVYGPGNKGIPGRVGISTFGIFLHLGGCNVLPITYVDNCADAIVLASIAKGIDGEIFNIIDDDMITSRKFLKIYKKNVLNIHSIYLPHFLSYFLCYLWEKYYIISKGQIPLVFSRKKWNGYWSNTIYKNNKIKTKILWKQKTLFSDCISNYIKYQKDIRKIDA